LELHSTLFACGNKNPKINPRLWSKSNVVDVNDENADKLSNFEDVEKVKPGYLDASREWFKIYKRPDGKPFNVFAFDGGYKDKAFAEDIINETHEFWKGAIDGQKDQKLSWKNTKQSGVATLISQEEAKKVVDAEPAFAAGSAISDMKAAGSTSPRRSDTLWSGNEKSKLSDED